MVMMAASATGARVAFVAIAFLHAAPLLRAAGPTNTADCRGGEKRDPDANSAHARLLTLSHSSARAKCQLQQRLTRARPQPSLPNLPFQKHDSMALIAAPRRRSNNGRRDASWINHQG